MQADQKAEVSALAEEAEMPLEELLARMGYARRTADKARAAEAATATAAQGTTKASTSAPAAKKALTSASAAQPAAASDKIGGNTSAEGRKSTPGMGTAAAVQATELATPAAGTVVKTEPVAAAVKPETDVAPASAAGLPVGPNGGQDAERDEGTGTRAADRAAGTSPAASAGKANAVLTDKPSAAAVRPTQSGDSSGTASSGDWAAMLEEEGDDQQGMPYTQASLRRRCMGAI